MPGKHITGRDKVQRRAIELLWKSEPLSVDEGTKYTKGVFTISVYYNGKGQISEAHLYRKGETYPIKNLTGHTKDKAEEIQEWFKDPELRE